MTRVIAQPGPADHFTDIPGLNLGHAENDTVATGTTVVLPDHPVAMAVDVRGGGPGTRETEALDPTCLVDRVHALVLSGGSVFGLSAADRVSLMLSEAGVGLDLGPRHVPVVPSAILFDLRNGGDKDWGLESPYPALGTSALKAAQSAQVGSAPQDTRLGLVGAGRGALAGDRPGGFGSASFVLDHGLMVSALVAVNSFGPVCLEGGGDPVTLGDIQTPKMGLLGANTTIGAVATNATLDKAQCKRVAMMAQDGLARTIRPIHTPFDGDSIFAMATGNWSDDTILMPNLLTLIGTLAADALVRAVQKAVAPL